MKRRALIAAGVFVAAGLAVLLAAVFSPARRAAAPPAAGSDGGAQIVLRGVELSDLRDAGTVCRLTADRAAWSLAGRTVTADGVTLFLPGRGGESVVRAPRAAWDLAAATIALPGGCSAEAPGGWSAKAASGRVDLAADRFHGLGEAAVAGPGLVVRGTELVWSWKDGTIAMEKPVSRIAAGAAARRKG